MHGNSVPVSLLNWSKGVNNIWRQRLTANPVKTTYCTHMTRQKAVAIPSEFSYIGSSPQEARVESSPPWNPELQANIF
jgi:hypothetical protein